MLPKFKKPVRWTLSDPQSLKLLGFIAKNDEAEKKIQIDDKMHEVEDLLKVNPLKMLKYTK